MSDYTRRGIVQGRNVRLMTVTVRPGLPNAAASGFVSGDIREPLAGVRAVCPVGGDTPIAVRRRGRTIDGLLRAITTDAAAWGPSLAVNFPALTVTPDEMVAAMDRVAGRPASTLIDWEPDPKVGGAIVASWPARFVTAGPTPSASPPSRTSTPSSAPTSTSSPLPRRRRGQSRLNELAESKGVEPGEVGELVKAHHGSLAREQRVLIEDQFKRGALRAWSPRAASSWASTWGRSTW